MGARFQILSLSGGGYRGLYTATVLAELEEALGGTPLARSFDLITGTSVGGILALGLALEIPAARLAELFEHHGQQIFQRQFSFCGYFRARYGSTSLRKLLSQPALFGDRMLGSTLHRRPFPRSTTRRDCPSCSRPITTRVSRAIFEKLLLI